jgi:hypothetical protein
LRIERLEDRCVPSTITPTTFADGGLGSGSLRDAVLQFNADSGTDDDIIQLQPGTYSLTIQNIFGRHETAGLTGDLNLNSTSHRWIIHGAGSSGDNPTIIDAGQLGDRVFEIVNAGTQVVFNDLVIQGGLAQEDGVDGRFQGTQDALGGGILNNGADLTLDHVVVQGNRAVGGDATHVRFPGYFACGAGIYSFGGSLTIAGAKITNNQAFGGRGGDSSLGNPAGAGGSAIGGGLYAVFGSLDVSDSRIANNRITGGRGGDGGFYYTSSGRTVFLGGSGGTAQGAGLYVNGSSLTVASSSIASNQATGGSSGPYGSAGVGDGGGLYTSSNAGTPTVTGTTLSDNSASGPSGFSRFGFGGGIYNDQVGTLTVSSCTLSGNSAGSGGGIYNQGMATVNNSTLSGNSADSGGGMYNQGTATVTYSTLSGNSVLGPNSYGGGIVNQGTLTVSNSNLSGNSAGFAAGGISNGGALTVINSTLSGNSADYFGGGIITGGTLTVVNSTLSGNRAVSGFGGGLMIDFGSPLLHDTLIAGNFWGTGTNRSDVVGALYPGGDYNLIGDGSGMTGLQNGVNGNQVGSANAPIDPLLGPLQDNGGPTQTMALLPGSPAIDAGNNDYANDWDQRGPGYPRIVNGIIDIGAFEYQGDGRGPTSPPLRPDTARPLALLNFVATLDREHQAMLSAPMSSNSAPIEVEPNRVTGAAESVPKDLPVDRMFAWRYEKEPWQAGVWGQKLATDSIREELYCLDEG